MAGGSHAEPGIMDKARDEILGLQQEINKIYLSGVSTEHFDRQIEAVKANMRTGEYSVAIHDAHKIRYELEGFKRDLKALQALMSEASSAIAKADGLGLSVDEVDADMKNAEKHVKTGELHEASTIVRKHLTWLNEALWAYDAARDAILEAQQTVVKMSLSGADTSRWERLLNRAREEMRRKHFAKALSIAHKANADKTGQEIERRKVKEHFQKLSSLIGEATKRNLDISVTDRTHKEAKAKLAKGQVAMAARIVAKAIEELEPRINAYDHTAGLLRRAEELYNKLSSDVAPNEKTTEALGKIKRFQSSGKYSEAQLLSTRIIEEMEQHRRLLRQIEASRPLVSRYMDHLMEMGHDLKPFEDDLKQIRKHSAEWNFEKSLQVMRGALERLVKKLAIEDNLDNLQMLFSRRMLEVPVEEPIHIELEEKLKRARNLRASGDKGKAYQILEENLFLADKFLAARMAEFLRPTRPAEMGQIPPSIGVGPQLEPQPHAPQSSQVRTIPAVQPSAPVSPQPEIDGPAPGTMVSSSAVGEVKEENGQTILQESLSLSSDVGLLGMDATPMEELCKDIRSLVDTGDLSGAEALLELMRQSASPHPFPFTHGVEMELALVDSNGSWVTGEQVTRVIRDLVQEGIEHLRGMIGGGQVPSFVSERFVDIRIARPDHPKRDKVIQLDYMVDGQLTTTEILGRDAHGVGTTYIVEIVSPPCRYVEELLWWLSSLQNVCCTVLGERYPEVLLISVGLNPIQPYSECISFGDHHHIKLPDEFKTRQAYNMLRAHVPHLIALTVNSPIYQGNVPSIKWDGSHPLQLSSRTDFFSIRLRENIGQLGPVGGTYLPHLREGEGPDFFTKAVNKATANDARLVDIYPFTRFGTIELRFFDAQLSIVDRVGIACIIQALCIWAIRLAQEGMEIPEVNGQVLLENRDRAIQKGLLLGFQRDKDLEAVHSWFSSLYQYYPDLPECKVKRLHDAVKVMFYNIWEDLNAIAPNGCLGGFLDTYLLMVYGGKEHILPEPVSPSQFLLFYLISVCDRDLPTLLRYLNEITVRCSTEPRANPIVELLGSPELPSDEDNAGAEAEAGDMEAEAGVIGEAVEGPECGDHLPLGPLAIVMDTAPRIDMDFEEGMKLTGPQGAEVQESPSNGGASIRSGESNTSLEFPSNPEDGLSDARLTSNTGRTVEGSVKPDIAGTGSGPTCQACGARVRWGFQYCPVCGTTMAYDCPSCGRPIQYFWQFCPTCGTVISNRDERKNGRADL